MPTQYTPVITGTKAFNLINTSDLSFVLAQVIDAMEYQLRETAARLGEADEEILAAMDSLIAANNALIFIGVLNGTSTSPGAYTPAAECGYVYKVATGGYINGQKVEIGDTFICTSDNTAAATSSTYSSIQSKWIVLQTNTDGVVIGPASSVGGRIATFNGTTGKLIQDSGKSFNTATPSSTSTDNDIPTSKAVWSLIDGLDVSNISGFGAGKTLSALSETNGKISATFQNISITKSQVSDLSIVDNTTATALSSSGTSLPTERTIYYGLPKINNANNYNRNTTIYAPTTGGTKDTTALVGDGTTTAPKWTNINPSISITAGDGSNAPKINVTVLGQSGTTAQALTKASTSVYGVTKLSSTSSSSEEGLAATPKLVYDSIAALDVNDITGFDQGKTLESLTETDGKISATFQDIEITADQISDLTITLNGSPTSAPSFYAPTEDGTTGQILKANASGAPTWIDAVPVTNGGTGLTTMGSTNAVLVSNNQSATGSIQTVSPANGAFYATSTNVTPQFGTLPVAQGGTGTTSFTSGALLIGNGTSAVTTRSITNNASNTAISASTNIPTMNTIYYGLAQINGASQNRGVSVYAPTTAGTNGQVLVSSGSGAPSWASKTLVQIVRW